MYAFMRTGMCIFSEPSQVVGSDVNSLLSGQLEVAISSPRKTLGSSNWQIDLHDFD